MKDRSQCGGSERSERHRVASGTTQAEVLLGQSTQAQSRQQQAGFRTQSWPAPRQRNQWGSCATRAIVAQQSPQLVAETGPAQAMQVDGGLLRLVPQIEQRSIEL